MNDNEGTMSLSKMTTTMTTKGKQQQQSIVTDLSGPADESQWRIHGRSRRRQLLENDKSKGGRDFSLSFDCSVQRYFSVAHWALEQFHELYQSSLKKTTMTTTETNEQLEEIYVMGHRILSYLTECLPRHPELNQAPEVRERTEYELDLLWKCVEDVALRIDETVCNQCVDDGDLFIERLIAAAMDDDDDDDSAITEDSSMPEDDDDDDDDRINRMSTKSFTTPTSRMVRFEDWVPFPNKNLKKDVTTGASETIGTSGTESLESLDASYTDTFSPDINHNHEHNNNNNSNSNTPVVSVPSLDHITDQNASSSSLRCRYTTLKSVRLDFLDKISREEVLYETDSEAADSWANGGDNSVTGSGSGGGGHNNSIKFCLASSSGVTPTCDPARIAFRDLMNRLPRESILQRGFEDDVRQLQPENVALQSPSSSSTFIDIMDDNIVAAAVSYTTTAPTEEQQVPDYDDAFDDENEIKQYLDSTDNDDEDPTKLIDVLCHRKKLKTTSNTTGDSYTIIRPQRRDVTQLSPLSFDTSSLPSSSSLSSSELTSLNNRTEIQTSAFSLSNSHQPEQQQQQQQPQKTYQQRQHYSEKSNADEILQNPARRIAQPFESTTRNFLEQNDWISFDNYSNTSYFTSPSNL